MVTERNYEVTAIDADDEKDHHLFMILGNLNTRQGMDSIQLEDINTKST